MATPLAVASAECVCPHSCVSPFPHSIYVLGVTLTQNPIFSNTLGKCSLLFVLYAFEFLVVSFQIFRLAFFFLSMLFSLTKPFFPQKN